MEKKSPHNKTAGQHFGSEENPLVYFDGLLPSFRLKFTALSDTYILQLLIAGVKKISDIQR